MPGPKSFTNKIHKLLFVTLASISPVEGEEVRKTHKALNKMIRKIMSLSFFAIGLLIVDSAHAATKALTALRVAYSSISGAVSSRYSPRRVGLCQRSSRMSFNF